MKTVVCFGDSNTWGAGVFTGTVPRHDYQHRWTTILQNTLSEIHGENTYRVIDNGVGGRTVATDSPTHGDALNGFKNLPAMIWAHYPIDTLVIMLGTNDVTDQYALSPQQITAHMMQLVTCAIHWHTVQNPTFDTVGSMPHIILICPAFIQDTSMPCIETQESMKEKSRALRPLYKSLAHSMGLTFLDANAVVTACNGDGVHWDIDSHKKFGEYLAPFI